MTTADEPPEFAGIEEIREFPEMPETLFSQILGIKGPAAVSVSFPLGYDESVTYPVVAFLGGSQGHNGHSTRPVRNVFGEEKFICVSLPYFLENLEPLKEDGSNKWQRMFIGPEEAPFIWAQYEKLLAEAFSLIPHADPAQCYIGGFSNGANTTVALLNHEESREGLLKYFRNFILIEGGMGLELATAPVSSDVRYYVVWGGKDDGGRERLIKKMKEMADGLSEKGEATITSREMPDTGHALPDTEHENLRKWALREL